MEPHRRTQKKRLQRHCTKRCISRRRLRQKPFRGGADADVESGLRSRFKRGLDKYYQVVLRLLAAYWDDPVFGDYTKAFYRLILGETLPNLVLSRPDDLKRALECVGQDKFPESAKLAYDIFNDVFHGITVSIDSYSTRTAAWADAQVGVNLPFRKRHCEVVSRTHSYTFNLDWADTCEFGSIMVKPGDGYLYKLKYDSIEYRVDGRGFFAKLVAFSGTKAPLEDVGKRKQPSEPAQDVIVSAVTVDIRVSWDGPTDEARRKIDEMIEKGEIPPAPVAEDVVSPPARRV